METATAVAQYLSVCHYRRLSPATLRGYRWALSRLSWSCPEIPISTDPSSMCL